MPRILKTSCFWETS